MEEDPIGTVRVLELDDSPVELHIVLRTKGTAQERNKLKWNRNTQVFSAVSEESATSSGGSRIHRSIDTDGILGTLRVSSATVVLIYITASTVIGRFPGGHAIRIVKGLDFLLLHGGTHSTASTTEMNSAKKYLSLVRKFCGKHACGLYFSNTTNIAVPFSPKSSLHNEQLFLDSFCWNAPQTRESFPGELASLVVPAVICGYVQVSSLPLHRANDSKEQVIHCCLVTRLSSRYSGTRYNRRGCDRSSGYVGNFCFSEQVLWRNKTETGDQQTRTSEECFSFISLRGSVPVSWAQPPDLRLVPKITIDTGSLEESLRRHLLLLDSLFASSEKEPDPALSVAGGTEPRAFAFHCINLLGPRSKAEGPLCVAFSSAVLSVNERDVPLRERTHKAPVPPSCRLTTFDLGHHLRNSKPLSELRQSFLEVVQSDFDDFGFNHWTTNPGDGSTSMLKLQKGMFRVNCLDCLDRTNIAQAILGMTIVVQQAALLGITAPSTHNVLQNILRNMWADNGHQISRMYTGTQSHFGANELSFSDTEAFRPGIDQAKISLTRYFQQCFYDGEKQDAISLMTGQHRSVGSEKGSIGFHNMVIAVMLVLTLTICIATFALEEFFGAMNPLLGLSACSSSVLIFIILILYIHGNRQNFVNAPQLT